MKNNEYIILAYNEFGTVLNTFEFDGIMPETVLNTVKDMMLKGDLNRLKVFKLNENKDGRNLVNNFTKDDIIKLYNLQ